ncbi:protein LATE ELONGATED HYPOCOTYL-like isoform X1 [Primulina tabacum]|uniref:protein LATE ELONGATED HYPOCOTYL-like isoform X1 n=2 Tax=Primulina tabacum TaxID=48773 RepID=UPI003F595E02
MDPYSSGEELLVKTRKPYTITKQRERWTEEEHNKFLVALKLYGRAWQRIEEHIGTKTAVQIRSHAQKFFTKLEKESFVKEIPIGHTLNINIPPPRPKRKPSNPYPRKTSAGVKDGKPSAPLSFLCPGQMTLDLEQEPLSEKSSDDGNNRKHVDINLENDSPVFSIHKTGACANSSSVNKNSSASVAPINFFTFREYVPLSTETSNKDETSQAFDSKQLRTNQTCNKQLLQDDNTSNVGNSCLSHEKYGHGNRIDELKQSKSIDNFPTTNDDASQNCLPHIPVNILEGSFGMNTQNVVLEDTAHTDSGYQKMGVLGPPCLFMNPGGSTTPEHHGNASSSSVHQSFPGFHPLSATFQHQDDYHSFLHISSTFSSLLVSALLQNPAAYAAASFAATLWPCVTMDTSGETSTGTPRGLQPKQMNTVPSMATIAAATVAAATAWWAAHGLLPLCPPLHPGFTSTAPSTSATPIDANTRAANDDKKEVIPDLALEDQPECLEEFQEQHSTLSSSCSEGSEGGKPNPGPAVTETAPMADTAEPLDSNKSKSRKKVDRSSCGSNTPSSSEVEAEGKEEKDVQDKELKEDEENHPSSDPISRRCRSLCSINDPWKEVSEEGRLAFQALFSREILPQTFSHDLNFKRKKNSDMENTEGWLQFNPSDQIRLDDKKEESTTKACRIGFKPYKRCSVEAKDTRMSTNCKDEEKGPKRFRVGGIDKDST